MPFFIPFKDMIMSEEINTAIKFLSEVYDIDSKDTYVSMYLNKQKNYQKFLDKRIKAISTILKGDILKNFSETINLIEHKIKKENWNNIAIFYQLNITSINILFYQ